MQPPRDKLHRITKEIQAKLRQLGDQLRGGNDSAIMVWLLDGTLACSHRPLRYHPDFGVHPSRCRCGSCRNSLPPEAKQLVVDWVERAKFEGVRSIISLLEDDQHQKYYLRGSLGLHPEGLFGYYRMQGFNFCHLPMTDFQTPSKSQMETVLKAFERLPKPVLLQCSAGIDRTSPVAAYIVFKHGFE